MPATRSIGDTAACTLKQPVIRVHFKVIRLCPQPPTSVEFAAHISSSTDDDPRRDVAADVLETQSAFSLGAPGVQLIVAEPDAPVVDLSHRMLQVASWLNRCPTS